MADGVPIITGIITDRSVYPLPRLIDVGCGPAKKPGHVGIDHYAFPCVDIVRDVAKRGLPFDDNSVDGIWSHHFMEHVGGEDLLFLIEEFYRVSKPSAQWTIIVPDATSPNRYRDPTHLTRDWQADSFMMWQVDEQGKRLIFVGPSYGRKAKLQVVSTAINSNLDRMYQIRALKP